MGRPKLERLFNFFFNIVLLRRRHHVEAGVNCLGVVFDGNIRLRRLVAEDPRLALGHDIIAKFALRQRVTPLRKGTFGVLHDVALVDEVNVLALVRQRPLNRRAHQALSTFDRYRL